MGLWAWLEGKLLDAFTGVHLTGVEITLGVGDELMDPMELAGVAAVVTGLSDDGAVLPEEGPNDIVSSVGEQKKFLVGVDGERELPGGTCAQGLGTYGKLFYEFALLGEDLDAVVDAVANVDQAVNGDVHAVDGVTKLLIRGRGGIVGTGIGIIRRVTVGSPKSLECASFRIEDDDTLI